MSLVFITGAGRRIGRGLAINFAKNGWDVSINYNSSESEAIKTRDICRQYGVKANIYKADVSNKEEVMSCLDDIVRTMGVPNVLVNNAGVYPERTALKDISEELIDSTFAINLKGEFFTSQYFSQLAQPNSRIINIASLGALEVWKGRIPYHISKSALVHLTRALSLELAPNISVNCVCPGAIEVPNEQENAAPLLSVDKIPMKRYGTPEDIFDAVYFFATCTSYITGQTIIVDGGYHNSR
jgi:3-oxoacyl-[acyl-carrier protein] reductase/pteridine reductase